MCSMPTGATTRRPGHHRPHTLPIIELHDIAVLCERVPGRHILKNRPNSFSYVSKIPWKPPPINVLATQVTATQYCVTHGLKMEFRLEDLTEATFLVRKFLEKREKVKLAVRRMAAAIRVLKRAVGEYVQRRRKMIEECCAMWDEAEESQRAAFKARIASRVLKMRPIKGTLSLEAMKRRPQLLTAEEAKEFVRPPICRAHKLDAIIKYRAAMLQHFHKKMSEWNFIFGDSIRQLRKRALQLFGTLLPLPLMMWRSGITHPPRFKYKVSLDRILVEHEKQEQVRDKEALIEFSKRVEEAEANLKPKNKTEEEGGKEAGELADLKQKRKQAEFDEATLQKTNRKQSTDPAEVFWHSQKPFLSSNEWMRDLPREQPLRPCVSEALERRRIEVSDHQETESNKLERQQEGDVLLPDIYQWGSSRDTLLPTESNNENKNNAAIPASNMRRVLLARHRARMPKPVEFDPLKFALNWELGQSMPTFHSSFSYLPRSNNNNDEQEEAANNRGSVPATSVMIPQPPQSARSSIPPPSRLNRKSSKKKEKRTKW